MILAKKVPFCRKRGFYYDFELGQEYKKLNNKKD